MFRALLTHPLTRGLDIDDPRTTHIRQRIIREKRFLRQIYEEWYKELADALPEGREPVLELGSGAGFLNDFVPDLITSDVFRCPGIDVVLDGSQRLPFAEGCLRGIVMTNVLHHLPHPRRFFKEATRCVRLGGVIVMIEPWVTPWSRLVYGRLHHESFRPEASEWEFPSSGPLSGANVALPWIVFERDRAQFRLEFPEWQIQTTEPIMPFRYLVSGDVSLRSLTPHRTFELWRLMEKSFQPLMKTLAMFAQVTLVRV